MLAASRRGLHHKAYSMEPGNWAPEHSDALREYFAMGMSFSEIARTINDRFGTTYTRNAALGRSKRMGLVSVRRIESPPLVPHQPGSPPPPKRCASSPRHFERPPNSAFRRAEPLKLRCVGVQPRLVSLVELERGDCRYPYGGDKDDEPIVFCGHPKRAGSSYCAPHSELTRGPGALSERVATRALLRLVASS